MTPTEGTPEFRSRLLGTALAGALLSLFAVVLLGFLLRQGAAPAAAAWLARFLSLGGWLAVLLLGLGGGALGSLGFARHARQRWGTLGIGVAALAGAVVIAAGARGQLPAGQGAPRTPSAKARAILRWSFRSPQTVAQILPYARDPNPVVREQAVLALGVNLVVSDIERAGPRSPARYADHPVRAKIGAALRGALADSVEAVRAEAARALWKAPRTFGAEPAAAETLAAVLARALRPGAAERMAWLALDAAAGAPHPVLKAAAARFGDATSDPDLARAARAAAAPGP